MKAARRVEELEGEDAGVAAGHGCKKIDALALQQA